MKLAKIKLEKKRFVLRKETSAGEKAFYKEAGPLPIRMELKEGLKTNSITTPKNKTSVWVVVIFLDKDRTKGMVQGKPNSEVTFIVQDMAEQVCISNVGQEVGILKYEGVLGIPFDVFCKGLSADAIYSLEEVWTLNMEDDN